MIYNSQDWNFEKIDKTLMLDPKLKITELTGTYNRGDTYGSRFFLDIFSVKPFFRGMNDYELRGVSSRTHSGIWIKKQCAKYDPKKKDNPVPIRWGFMTLEKSLMIIKEEI